MVESPLGSIIIVADDLGLHALTFSSVEEEEAKLKEVGANIGALIVQDDHPLLHQARRQLKAYFSGKRRAFTLPLEFHGSPFQCRVWDALRHIPYGQKVSYGEVARRIGQPKASRAVAQACGANPMAIIVPCHRVIGADGGLGGYSAGRAKKRRLLSLEGHNSSALPLFSVAQRREEDSQRETLERALVERLPKATYEAFSAHRLPSGLTQEDLLVEAMTHLDASDLPALASTLARIASEEPSTCASGITEGLLALLCARLLDSIPPLSELECMLHAALLTNSPTYLLIGRRLASSPVLTPAHRHLLEETYQRVMRGDQEVDRSVKEATVDLWLDLKKRDGDDPWVADRCEKPHEVFQSAGLLWEAALAAEHALNSGQGDPIQIRAKLVDMYQELGDLGSARDHLIALLADEETPERMIQLRQLKQSIEEADQV